MLVSLLVYLIRTNFVSDQKSWISDRVKQCHTGTIVTTLDDIAAAEWGPDRSIIVCSTWTDGRIEVIDPLLNAPLRAYEGHSGVVRSLHISKTDPNTLISASHDKKVILWDFRSNNSIITLLQMNYS